MSSLNGTSGDIRCVSRWVVPPNESAVFPLGRFPEQIPRQISEDGRKRRVILVCSAGETAGLRILMKCCHNFLTIQERGSSANCFTEMWGELSEFIMHEEDSYSDALF
jgi:hypothetical protein